MKVYNRYLIYFGAVTLIALCLWACKSNSTPPPEDTGPRKIEILFLGHDSEHHHSELFMPMLASALADKGINFTYTNDPAVLNPSTLNQYDGFALYANHDEITKSQEKALLNFVESGRGFIPIHCASYCFRNSDKFVELVGAQFKSHEVGTFTADISNAEHPITAGLEPFETWDETYVHHLHNENRTVLMERVEGDAKEPWTWIRTHGNGRIFYTAYGHDERTWNHPGFHTLMERGIKWAVGDIAAKNANALSFPERTYTEAKIPNYEQRDPPPKLQAPFNTEESHSLIQIPVGFELELFASEPQINTPVAMNFDEKGRLWYLETTDYPNEIKIEDMTGNDKIKIVEDTDGDGKADSFKVFAENLSVPTSLVFYDGGVIVSQAPHFLYLKDTDGDDKADVREILFSGWGTFDTHAGPSNLRYGFDNWIWGTVGYSGFDGIVGEDTLKFGQGIYRFKPDGSKLEYMGSTSNNTWGLGFTETFDILASTANNTHSAYLGIPGKYYEGTIGIKGRDVKKIDGHYLFHPITQNVRQVDVFGGFTAAAGHNFYTARSFPKEYWNRIAFVCEPTGHLLHNAILEGDGAGFKESDGWNLLASADEWVSPIHTEIGPEGNLWILDWYNFIIQHNPTPPGFENGFGNAHINPLRDKQRGRIYKLSYKAGKKGKAYDLDHESTADLLAALKSENMKWRLHAQRLLVESGQLDVVNQLIAIAKDRSVDEIGLNGPAIHALWTLDGLGAINDAKVVDLLRTSLKHPAAGVRKAAIQILPKHEENLDAMVDAKVFYDQDAHTRLAAFLTLADMPFSNKVGDIVYELSQDQSLEQDEWLSKALYILMVRHKNSFIKSLEANHPDFMSLVSMEDAEAIDWLDVNLDVSSWGDIKVPARWSESGATDLHETDGTMWYHTTVNLNASQARGGGKIHFGVIDETDSVYINGKLVGNTVRSWGGTRSYTFGKGVLKSGRNVIAINVEDYGGRGGILGDPKEGVYLQAGNDKIDLAGKWKYKLESVFRRDAPIFINGQTPLKLFLENYSPYANQVSNQLKEEAGPADQSITIKTVREQMKYDIEEFTVKAGTTIEIVFENTDAMQHNLLICTPGSLEKVGAAADRLATSPLGLSQGYVPKMPEVLKASILIDPGTTTTIRFKVPDKGGDYPYICTFPAHWRMMNGVMKVVEGEI